MDLFAGEGSNLDEIVAEQIGWDIDVFCIAKRGMKKHQAPVDIVDDICGIYLAEM